MAVTQSMPQITAAHVPEPLLLSTLTATNFASGATPTTPIVLLTAAIVALMQARLYLLPTMIRLLRYQRLQILMDNQEVWGHPQHMEQMIHLQVLAIMVALLILGLLASLSILRGKVADIIP